MATTASAGAPPANWAADLAAVRLNCRQQWSRGQSAILTTHENHYGIVVGFFNKALDLKETAKTPEEVKDENRKKRCKALEKFIGRPINSFKKLTVTETEVLIERLKIPNEEKLKLSQDGAELIRWAEAQDDNEFFGDFHDDGTVQPISEPADCGGTAQEDQAEPLPLPGARRHAPYVLHLW